MAVGVHQGGATRRRRPRVVVGVVACTLVLLLIVASVGGSCGPALVVTGDRDGSFTLGEGRKTATAWGCDFTPLVGASHDLMVEPGWEKAAQAMLDWIDQKVTQDL